MKYSIKEFAQEIRKTYPNDYNDLSDDELVHLWLKKYPKDKNKIDFSKKEKTSFNFLWILFIIVGVFLLVKYYNENSSTINDDDKYINDYDNIDNKEQIEIQPKRSDYISSEVSIMVDSSDIMKIYELDNELKRKVKIILSAPPIQNDNQSGNYCSSEYTNCQWCSNSIEIPMIKKPIQSEIIYLFNGSKNPIIGLGYVLDATLGGKNSEIYKLLELLCDSYFSGQNYTCVWRDRFQETKFCSKKCEYEYS